jgi:HSP20 family protein
MQALFWPAARGLQEGRWYPPADVYRTPSGWLVKLDLAGVRPDEVELGISGSQLIVKGTRRDWTVHEQCRCYQMEIAYNRFERIIELEADLDPSSLRTEYRDGMLMVWIQPEAT